MEPSANEGVTSGEEAFKSCGRTGRRGACTGTDIARDKLQDIIQKVEEVSLDETEGSQTNQNEKET